ncbi:MAG TPA: copper resistance system multicopper oxidase [Rudaea sp.]|jgi:CopA family copper-resistance protein
MKRLPGDVPTFSGSRRHFVTGVALGGVAASLGLLRPIRAEPARMRVAELSGSEFDLDIGATTVNFTGAARSATVVNGSLPAPILRWRRGDTVTLRVRNSLLTTSSIHWHGIVLPADMDGVPGLSFMGIAPQSSYTYRFRVNQSGTYWYHSHSRFQEQTGLYGAIVVEPRDGDRLRADRDHVVLLSDWSDSDPEHLYATLKKQSNYYNFAQPTAADFLRDAGANGISAALDRRAMWNRMRMDPSDLSDVSGHAYTYLMNGATPAANWSGVFARGERVRLRFINGASMTFFDVRVPGLKLTVVAVDGQDVEPVTVDEFRLGPAETCDVIVAPDDERAYTIFAQAMDRSGYARGTLAPRDGMQGDVPALDPRPLLGMVDMMGDMGMPGRNHGSMPMKGAEGSCGAGMPGMNAKAAAPSLATGPGIDMTVATPRTNLDDPGIGLRDNGRRVLTYADLHTSGPAISRDAQREIVLHLTGHMGRYIWSFDGQKFSDAAPLRLRHGEQVRITLVNDTMMTHPIHLHGMWSELETSQGEFLVRKHTVVVQPAQKLSYRVSADAIGLWAYHCHLLYHMEAGMFREVVVA